MSPKPSKNDPQAFMARVQKMAKWIAGHAVVVRGCGKVLVVTVGGDSFDVDGSAFPDELTIARCALAVSAMGIAGNFNVGDFDDETLYRFLPPMEHEGARAKWAAYPALTIKYGEVG